MTLSSHKFCCYVKYLDVINIIDIMKKYFFIPFIIVLVCVGSGLLPPGQTTYSTEDVVMGAAEGISAGGQHACAVTTAQGVMCWGRGEFLGTGSAEDQSKPARVNGLQVPIKKVVAAQNHTCALTLDGKVKCWGRNDYGQLGTGNYYASLLPADVQGLNQEIIDLALGSRHTCALTALGAVKCWGSNIIGQLGDGSAYEKRWVPSDVQGLNLGVNKISAGNDVTCALTSGRVLCWGDINTISDGRCGGIKRAPTEMCDLDERATDIAVGYDHGCAVLASQKVKCWGQNADGQLGNGSTVSGLPVWVADLGNIASVAAGAKQSCAISNARTAKCWGKNLNGQLGDGSTVPRLTPVSVNNLGGAIIDISVGKFQIDTGEDTQAIGGFACTLSTATQAVRCWGNNKFGMLGDGTRTNRSIPVLVSGFEGTVATPVPPTPVPSRRKDIYFPVNLYNLVIEEPISSEPPPTTDGYFVGPGEIEPNDTVAQANGPLESGKDYYALPNDRIDMFSIDLAENRVIQVIVSGNNCPRLRVQLSYHDVSPVVAEDGVLRGVIVFNATQTGRYYISVDNGLVCSQESNYTIQVIYR